MSYSRNRPARSTDFRVKPQDSDNSVVEANCRQSLGRAGQLSTRDRLQFPVGGLAGKIAGTLAPRFNSGHRLLDARFEISPYSRNSIGSMPTQPPASTT